MAMCGIMRIEKRGRHAVGGLQKEAVRDEFDRGTNFDNSDIDWDRTRENIRLRDCRQWNKEITREIHAAGVKERKDSIVMLDGLYTASPEWFESHTKQEWIDYFKDCLEYHDRTYGKAFSAVIHLDEATPHMQVASVPLIEDEKGWHLSAKIVMGGRSEYRHRQEDFYQTVTKSRGLERGEIREPAETKKHIAVQKYKLQQNSEKLETQEYTITKNKDMLSRQRRTYDTAKKVISQARDVEPLVRSLDAAPDSSTIAQSARKSIFGSKMKIPAGDLEKLVQRASAGEGIEAAARETAQRERKARQDRQKAAADRQAAQEERAAAERIRSGEEYKAQAERVSDVVNRYNKIVPEYNDLLEKRNALQRDVSDLADDIDHLRNEGYMRRFCRKYQQEFDEFVQQEKSREWER